MEAIISPFIDYLKFEKRYSAHTIRSYRDDLEGFFVFLRDEFGEMGLREITPAVVRTWLAALKDGGLSSRSVNRKISSLRSFYKYQLRVGAVEVSPMGAIVGPRQNKRLPVFVEEGDIAQLFAGIQFPDDWEGWTDRLLLAILYHTGMRLSELVNLRERQADTGNRTIKVLGKGNKERVIPVSPVLMAMIEEYKHLKRVELEAPDVEFLLVGRKGKKLYAKYVYRVVHAYLAQVTTIDQKSPHVLRHTFATHLMNAGAELNSVKELLGHASLAATQVYTHNTIEKLKDIYKKAHPKA
ncbi:tyrosine-type recombinase/integrase [Puia dinghuensis]|uniref:Tyrosine recombinase XerC n=1 Tax=Puia dinghuensis TaxID=1792502 RepID=A0A8J2UGW1_9BACT|nr:tyrosine-type recombinase/integrase [Puia dinghuensis]GGB15346.1 tyrosine recombinase XerC [Puia dinghuensis]